MLLSYRRFHVLDHKLENFVIEHPESHDFFLLLYSSLNERKFDVQEKKSHVPGLSMHFNEGTFLFFSTCMVGLLMHQASKHTAKVWRVLSPRGFARGKVDLLLLT